MAEAEIGAYKDRAIEEFSKRTKVLLEQLEKPIAEGSLTFGPIYHLTSSSGQKLKLHVLSTPLATPYFAPLMKSRKITIFAENEDGKLAGFKTADLLDYSQYDYEDEEQPFERGHEIKASGEIVTSERDIGAGTAMELLYLFLLQQEANKRGVKVAHRVDPSNLRVLGSFLDLGESVMGSKALQAKQREAERWNKIYGSSGLLGFKDYTRTFSPEVNASQTVPDNSREVWLERVEKTIDGRRVDSAQIVNIETSDDPSQFYQEQLSYFNSHILPQLRSVV